MENIENNVSVAKQPLTEIEKQEVAQKLSKLLDLVDVFFINRTKKRAYAPNVDEKDGSRFLAQVRELWIAKPQAMEKFLDQHRFLSREDRETIMGWKYAANGPFIWLGKKEGYAIFFSMTHLQFFGVTPLTEDFWEMMPQETPKIVFIHILPVSGIMVYDGLVAESTKDLSGPLPEDLKSLIDKVLEVYKTLDIEKDVITGMVTKR